MLVDYEFYKKTFKGKLSEEEFDKFVNLSCMKITKETCSRIPFISLIETIIQLFH